MKTILLLLLGLGLQATAQKKLPVLRSSNRVSTIYDGMVKVPWPLDPKIKTDVYYVNVPRRAGKVTLVTD